MYFEEEYARIDSLIQTGPEIREDEGGEVNAKRNFSLKVQLAIAKYSLEYITQHANEKEIIETTYNVDFANNPSIRDVRKAINQACENEAQLEDIVKNSQQYSPIRLVKKFVDKKY